MTIRAKTTLVLACTFVGMLGLLAILMANILSSSFQSLENRSMQRNAELARDSLRLMEENLGRKVLDWSMWDDSWNFMRTGDEHFIESNLGDEALINLDVNGIVLFSPLGEVQLARFMDLDTGKRSFMPADLGQHFARGQWLSTHRAEIDHKFGLISLNDGVYLIAAAPIVQSSGEGPVRGTIAFMRRIDEAATARLAAVTHQDLRIERTGISSPRSAPSRLLNPAGDMAALKPQGSHRISASLPISDIYGTRVGMLHVVHPRAVLAEGRESMRLFLLCMVAVAMGILFVAGRIIGRLVLTPLARLRAELERIAASGDLSVQLPVEGHDEVSELSLHFNRMTSALHHARAQIEEVARAAEAGNRAKTSFLANMSHEIRTPMTAILGYIDLLLEDDLSPSDRLNHMHTVQRNGRHLLQVINDVLDISKIEAGRLSVERITCSPVHIIADVTSMMRVRATEKALSFDIDFQTPIPDSIQSDPTRFRQILFNLVGNAIKFTERGGVTLRVRCITLADSDHQTHLEIDVEDTGIGMTDSQQKRLFAPFSQADHTTTRRFGGTGLGLVISRRLARMLGGDVKVRSESGRGSTFTLHLVVETVPGARMITNPAEALMEFEEQSHDSAMTVAKTMNRRAVRVLLAEDGPDNQRLISFLLTKAGHQVCVAENGELAMQLAQAAARDGAPFDVILMDMQMPVMDGYTATRKLRAAGYRGPVIALTAHAMREDRQKCIDAGCDDFASKPIDRETLLDLIDRASRGEFAGKGEGVAGNG